MVASPFGFENLSISVRSYERSVITELLIMVMGKSFDHRNHRHLSDTVCVCMRRRRTVDFLPLKYPNQNDKLAYHQRPGADLDTTYRLSGVLSGREVNEAPWCTFWFGWIEQ